MQDAKRAPDVVTFGETMGLIMPIGTRGLEFAPQLQKSFGGAESNVAIGLARLGHSVGWFGRLGDDPFGRLIYKTLRGEGVDVSRAVLAKDEPTGMMLREIVAGQNSVYYYRRFSAASRMRPEHLDPTYIQGAKILHITGITPALSETCRETVFAAVKIAKEAGTKVCFDPNLRLKLWSIEEARETILPLAAEADYFLPGLEELELLYDTDDFDTIVRHLNQLNAISVIKGAGEETRVLKDGKWTAVPYFQVEEIVDTVGAGDAFCAGFISGLLDGLDELEAVRLGNFLGALVLGMEGDWEALPNREYVQARLENRKHVER